MNFIHTEIFTTTRTQIFFEYRLDHTHTQTHVKTINQLKNFSHTLHYGRLYRQKYKKKHSRIRTIFQKFIISLLFILNTECVNKNDAKTRNWWEQKKL